MADYLRVSLVGDMPGGEKWSINPIYSVGGDFGAPVSPAQAATIATAIAAITPSSGVTQIWATSTRYLGVRVEARMLDDTLETQAEVLRATPVIGTGTVVHPFQTAWVSSLRTAFPGASGRGRLYFPATGVNIAPTTGRIINTTAASFNTDVRDWLSQIKAAIDVTLDGVSLCVLSKKLSALNPVTTLQAGDVLDTQRRRRDDLVETYYSLAF